MPKESRGRISAWTAGLVLLHLPCPIWILVEWVASASVAIGVASLVFLYTLIRGMNDLGGLGIVLALASFFSGLAGHQAIQWHRISNAPEARLITLQEVGDHKRAMRFSFVSAVVRSDALASKTITTRGRNGTSSSSTYYAAPIVDPRSNDAMVAAWSVGLNPTAVRSAGGVISGTVIDEGFNDGYRQAVQASENKFGLRSHPQAVLLDLGDPVHHLNFMFRTIWMTLAGVNLVWMIASSTMNRDE